MKVHYGEHVACEYGGCIIIRLACIPDNKFLQSPTWRHVTRDTWHGSPRDRRHRLSGGS